MKANEFCYWLQGYFEVGTANGIDRDHGSLSERALNCISAHIALVQKVDPDHGNLFVEWLAMFLRGARSLDTSGSAKVRRLLAAQFQHVIDPSYGGDQKELQQIHNGGTQPQIGGVGPDGQVYRC